MGGRHYFDPAHGVGITREILYPGASEEQRSRYRLQGCKVTLQELTRATNASACTVAETSTPKDPPSPKRRWTPPCRSRSRRYIPCIVHNGAQSSSSIPPPTQTHSFIYSEGHRKGRDERNHACSGDILRIPPACTGLAHRVAHDGQRSSRITRTPCMAARTSHPRTSINLITTGRFTPVSI